jgi:hypothetical protein
MKKRAPKPKPETPATVRAEAEEIGRQAFEAATADPQPTPESALSWLWKTPTRKAKR